jgi:hypothetical protein
MADFSLSLAVPLGRFLLLLDIVSIYFFCTMFFGKKKIYIKDEDQCPKGREEEEEEKEKSDPHQAFRGQRAQIKKAQILSSG